jgi:hypothetical protein
MCTDVSHRSRLDERRGRELTDMINVQVLDRPAQTASFSGG